MSINRADTAVRPDEAFASMKPVAERALQLDPLLAEAHAAMGVVLARDRKWADAEAAFRRAAELNGNLSSIRMNFVSSTLWPQGKVDQSVSQLRAALRRDPLSVDVQALLAYVLVSAGRYGGVDGDRSPHRAVGCRLQRRTQSQQTGPRARVVPTR